MVTAIVPRDLNLELPAGELLFSSDVLTNELSKRVAIRLPVAQLGVFVDSLPIEHIYDY